MNLAALKRWEVRQLTSFTRHEAVQDSLSLNPKNLKSEALNLNPRVNLDDQNRALWLAARIRLGGGQSISVSAIPAAQLSSICTVAPAGMAVAVAAVDMQRIGNFFCLDTLGMESAFAGKALLAFCSMLEGVLH